MDGYILGILWSIGYDAGEYFLLRYKNKELLEQVKSYFNIQSSVFLGESNTNEQWKLKIRGQTRINIITELTKQGWTSRNADIRQYPIGDIDHKGFIKAYIEIHSGCDCLKGKPRLRIYGNFRFITELNDIISRITGVGVKTPQKVHNGKTYVLYYQAYKEIKTIVKYFNLNQQEFSHPL